MRDYKVHGYSELGSAIASSLYYDLAKNPSIDLFQPSALADRKNSLTLDADEELIFLIAVNETRLPRVLGKCFVGPCMVIGSHAL